MNKQTVIVSLATYVVATAVLLVSASVLDLLPRDGVNGLTGISGKDGISPSIKTYVVVASKSARNYWPAVASCKKGDMLIGGGARVGDPDMTVNTVLSESFPKKNSWQARAVSVDGDYPYGMVMAYAICQSKD
jgi:hypothetical protein